MERYGLSSTVIPEPAVTLTSDLMIANLSHTFMTQIHLWQKFGEIPFISFLGFKNETKVWFIIFYAMWQQLHQAHSTAPRPAHAHGNLGK